MRALRIAFTVLCLALITNGSALAQSELTIPDNAAQAAPVENMVTPGEGVEPFEDDEDSAPLSPTQAAPDTKAEATSPVMEDTPLPSPNVIKLRGLNKVTARISVIEEPLGTVMRFGNLEIIAHRCWRAKPEEQPENAALLEIRELKPGEGPQTVFSGWMFSSSPALSSLEHPVYDVTLLTCEYKEKLEAE